VFDTLDIDVWRAARLTEPIRELASSGLVFCLALALAGFLLSFVVRWQAAAPLLTLVALPAAGAANVHPFLVALISLVSTQVWFLPTRAWCISRSTTAPASFSRTRARGASLGLGVRSCWHRSAPRFRYGARWGSSVKSPTRFG
jgi:hypothetical protein